MILVIATLVTIVCGLIGAINGELNISPNNVLDSALYFSGASFSPIISNPVHDIGTNFSIYMDISIYELGFQTGEINLFTYGNSTSFFQYNIGLQSTGSSTVSGSFMYTTKTGSVSSNNFIDVQQNTVAFFSSFLDLQILILCKNSNFTIQIQGIDLPIHLQNPGPIVPMFSIQNASSSIMFLSPGYSFYYNNFLLFNHSLSASQISDIFNGYPVMPVVQNGLTDLISGTTTSPNNSVIHRVYTYFDSDLQFTPISTFERLDFGITSIGFEVTSTKPILPVLSICDIDFSCDIASVNSYSSGSYYYYSTLVNCPITLNTPGIFPLYISTNYGYSYYPSTNFTVEEYLDNLQETQSVQETLPLQTSPVDTTVSTTETVILIGIALGLSVVGVLILLIHCCSKRKIKERLIKFDLLQITLRNKNVEEVEKDSRNGLLGIGSTFYSRSSLVGGMMTIFLIIVAIFISGAYLNDTLQNNEQISSYLSDSNGNILQNGHISASVTFKNLLYGVCGTNGVCSSDWSISSSFNYLQSGVPTYTSCNEVRISDLVTDCTITWGCNNCQPEEDQTTNAIVFVLTLPNVAFKGLDYSMGISSYTESDNILSGTLIPETGSITTAVTISIVSNPTVFNDQGSQGMGFTLDFQNDEIETIPMNLFNNSLAIPTYPAFDINQYFMDPLPINTITVEIIIARGSNWLYITKTIKTSVLLIFFQLISILVSLFSLSKIFLNLITKKRILVCCLRICTCGKGKAKKKDKTVADDVEVTKI